MIAKAENTPLEKVRVLQRNLYLAAKANPKRKFGVLYDKVCRGDVLQAAYAQVKANKGAPGIDHQTFDEIEREIGVGKFLSDIRKKLVPSGTSPFLFDGCISRRRTGHRAPLGIPVIADRVVQAAVKIVIEPLFEAIFKDFSYGFRPRKNAHQALREIYKWLNFGCHWVVDADLKSYFDTIPHDKLLMSVRSRVIDRSVVKLIELWLKAGVMEDMQVRKETTGTPQGGVISPLLANLYLHWLDQTWETTGVRPTAARCTYRAVCRRLRHFVQAERPEFYLAEAKKVLDRLGLTLNAQKTRIVNADEEPFDFLGHRFAVQPSKAKRQTEDVLLSVAQGDGSVKKKIQEVVRAGQHLESAHAH